MSPLIRDTRSHLKQNAISSKTIRGVFRHLYTAIAGYKEADNLFGYVRGAHSHMGRLVFHFAKAEPNLRLRWYALRFHYAEYIHKSLLYKRNHGKFRFFGFGKISQEIFHDLGNDEHPRNLQNVARDYQILRFAEPGSEFKMLLNFWNLTDREFAQLLYCISMHNHPNMKHKFGRGKALGLGTCHVRIEKCEKLNFRARYRRLDEDGYEEQNLQQVFKAYPFKGDEILNSWLCNG